MTQSLDVPNNLAEAVETLLAFYVDDISTVRKRTEGEFLALAHFAAGTFMRNPWCLFWFEGHPHDSWPNEKPPLVRYFNYQSILDADNMSEEILKAFFKKVQEMS